jgi:GNAT superfamily N-acetyltransferase
MPEMTVLPVTPGRWPDLAELFGTSEVMRGCWCMWPRTPCGGMRTGGANEARLRSLVDSGSAPGLLAYTDSMTAGWCSAGPRPHYARFFDERAGADIWLIACPFIAASHRGQGVASALIEAAVRRAAEHGARRIEAVPRGWRPDDDPATLDGLVRALRRAGFVEQTDAASPARLVRDLTSVDTARGA